MKRVFPISLAGYCAALVLSSCATEEQEFVSLRPVYEEFYASTEAPDFTRTHTDSQYRVLWNEDDRISIFNRDTYNQQYRFSGETGDNSGSFSIIQSSDFITANPISAIYAVYPYAEGTRISNDEVLSVSLPSTQMWAQDSFGPGANVMVAAADDNKLMFKNAGGILSFKLYGANASVSSLQLKSNGGEAISGKASVTMTVGGLPVLTMDDSASDHVMLICPSPVTLNADASAFTEFWFVLPPVTLSGGFTLTVTSPDGGTFTKSSTKPLTISRNTISRMAPVEVEFTGGAVIQPDNEIWYTTTDGRPVSIANESVLNAAVVSNTYQNGKGIIKLDGPLTSIGTVKGSYSSDNDAFLTNNVAPNLKSISFPESLSVLCTYAVWNCSLLENVSLPAHLDYLGGSAFSDCHRITSLNIPECTEIRFNPFAGCTGLTQLTGSHVSSDGLFLIKDGTLHTFAMKGQISCAIPEGIANIAPHCFSGSTIEELTLPSSLTKIGTNSFAGIRTLKRINFSEGLKSIGMHAFASSASLESVTLPQSLESLDYSAFANCSSLTTIHIPSGVNQLIQNPFPGCSSLSSFSGNFASADGRSLIDGDRLVSIAPAGLTTFAVPEGIRVLDWYLFAECSNLSGITIPEGVETVSNGCFNNCRALKELVMPSTWKEFDGSLFYGCTGLEKISILATVPPSNTINYVNKLFYSECTIYVPASSVEAYKSAQYWSDYADRIQPLAAVPEAVDLGLPSGLKWASFNLGATAPEGAGSFFAWGETLPKQYFGWDNYKWGTRTALTKYNSNSSLGTVDNLSELEAADDAAHAMLGGAWRMPTHSEQEELRDCCKWTVTTMNGVEGYLVSSKSNSNSIFLPITGTASGNEIRDTDEGYYWSSSLDSFSDENFYAAWFRLYLPQVTSTHANYGNPRCEGLAIRPVFN